MNHHRSAAASLGIALALTGSAAVAAGFQISEQTVAGMGQAFAGAGIARDDASNLFYNPAGLLANGERQVQFGASFISGKSEFTNTGSTRRLAGVTVPSSGPDADGGDDVVVPAFYYTSSGDDFKWGLSVSVPFGLATDYDDGWIGRYHALRSEVQAVNVNPGFAFRVGERLSLGAGVSVQKVDAELSQAVFRGPGVPDGEAKLKGDDTEVGFNLGVMFEPGDNTRLGLGYRSKIEHELEGRVRFSGVPGAPDSLPISSEATFPETIYASISHEMSPATEISGGVRWTKWSDLPELRIETLGMPDSVADYQWEDVAMYSIGVRHHINDRWTVRLGYARDEAPIPADENRTPRVPDSDRDWFTLGLSFAVGESSRIDFGYAHVVGEDSSMVNTINLVSSRPGAFTDTLRGDYESSVDIFGIQFYGEFR